jgi:hypothetical protein
MDERRSFGRCIGNLGVFTKLWKAILSFVISVCRSVRLSLSAWNNSFSNEGIFIRCYISGVFENISRKFKFHEYLTRITGSLYDDMCKLMIISR